MAGVSRQGVSNKTARAVLESIQPGDADRLSALIEFVHPGAAMGHSGLARVSGIDIGQARFGHPVVAG